MKRVSQSEVIEHWLQRELDKDGEDTPSASGCSAVELFRRNPDASRIFWEGNPLWYETCLTRAQFLRLRAVWDRVADPKQLREVGRLFNEERERFEKGQPDADYIEEISEAPYEYISDDHLIVIDNGVGRGSFLTDGNHRAVGLATALHQGGEYHPVPAFLGIDDRDLRAGIVPTLTAQLWCIHKLIS